MKLVSIISVTSVLLNVLVGSKMPMSEAHGVNGHHTNIIPNHYIIKFKKNLSLTSKATHFDLLNLVIAEELLLSSFKERKVHNKINHMYSVSGFEGYSGSFMPEVASKIREMEEVEFLEHDKVMTINENVQQKGAPWGLARISHRESLDFGNFNKYIHDPQAGNNVTAYIIDTGVNVDHVEFEGRAVWGKTIPLNDRDEDGNGHGTHVAGTIGSKKYGVAKGVKLVAVKVLRSNGSGSNSDVIKGVEWATNQAVKEARQAKAEGKTHKGSVANMSLGGSYSRLLNIIVDAAVEQGLHFAVAAGNDNADACRYSPASAEKAVSVGASNIADERAWFSNYGKCTDIFAPGNNILSTWNGSKYATNTISGTSMASPHVAGALAYILSQEDGPIDADKLKQKLLDLATKDIIEEIGKGSPNLLLFNGNNGINSKFN